MPDELTTQAEKPPHRGIKKGLYVIPTMFTAANVGMGFLAVLYSMRGFQVSTLNADQAGHYFNYAAIAMGLAILFDTLDGPNDADRDGDRRSVRLACGRLDIRYRAGCADVQLGYSPGPTGRKLGIPTRRFSAFHVSDVRNVSPRAI